MSEPQLTHLDSSGQASMVNVSEKEVTQRRAVAQATVRMSPDTALAVQQGDAPKGDVIAAARLAGIAAAKRTADLIPLCHVLPLDHVGIQIEVDAGQGTCTVKASASATARTGVEMEALCAAAVAALTLYDMVKGLERGVTIERVELLEKTGGRSGTWRAG